MKKILIIKQTSLGDVLHITAFIREIKKYFPDSEIDIVTDKKAVDILSYNPNINKLYVLDIYRYEKEILKSFKSFFKIIGEFFSYVFDVRKTKYDYAFDLQGLERTAVFLYAARAKEKYIKGKWLFLKRKVYKDVNAVEGYLSFLDFVGTKSENTKLDFYLPPNIEDIYREELQNAKIEIPKKYMVIAPFSRWETKDLPIEKCRMIITALEKEFDMPIVITSTKDEYQKCLDIAKGFKNIYILSGTLSILSLAFLIKNAFCMISVDSFPMHIASAFETPLVALFGATSVLRVGPVSKNSVVLRVDIPCSMCYLRKNCPNNMLCMNSIDENDIIKTIKKITK